MLIYVNLIKHCNNKSGLVVTKMKYHQKYDKCFVRVAYVCIHRMIPIEQPPYFMKMFTGQVK